MNKKEFGDSVRSYIKCIDAREIEPAYSESDSILQNAAIREAIFERRLRDDYKRKTTFASDFAIGEADGKKGVISTFKKALISWCDSYEYFAEIILVTNANCWYFHDRGQDDWSDLYESLYAIARGLYFDWFSGNQEAMDYYMEYVD